MFPTANTNTDSYIKTLYERYLKEYGNCSDLLEINDIRNEFSCIDALFKSGSTGSGVKTLVGLEHKRRLFSIKKYPNTMLQQSKINLMKRISVMLHCPVMYCAEFDDVILIYDLTNSIHTWTDKLVPINYGNPNKVSKPVTYLDPLDADFIISKRTYQRGTMEQLRRYLSMSE